jgi:hypothetical protein
MDDHTSDTPDISNSPELFCSGCGGARLLLPGTSYMHRKDCSSLFTGTPVFVVCGDLQIAIGSCRIVAGHSNEDISLMLAMMMRECGRNWLASLALEATGVTDRPMPDAVLAAAIELAEADGAEDQLVIGFRLSLALSEWLAEV